ncbi:hypothetical protein BS47DRAFT_1367682 [Hydnum rufescens UP504]|uniref:Uncharacterized protein n=1 Tax=Hydnum rufescens UP504 TaxID=1448309 RepID=A0A9P6DP76_9AGAM|nr:hypothetical protein BS47DRAFT_1367682 [Hydnum rufescens UP504]
MEQENQQEMGSDQQDLKNKEWTVVEIEVERAELFVGRVMGVLEASPVVSEDSLVWGPLADSLLIEGTVVSLVIVEDWAIQPAGVAAGLVGSWKTASAAGVNEMPKKADGKQAIGVQCAPSLTRLSKNPQRLARGRSGRCSPGTLQEWRIERKVREVEGNDGMQEMAEGRQQQAGSVGKWAGGEGDGRIAYERE